MKTIIATLIAAVLAACATVWSPTAATNTTPTIEPSPAVGAETVSVEPQEVVPAPQQELLEPAPAPQAEPDPPTATAAPEPAPAPQETIITEKEKTVPVIEAPEPTTEEPTIVEPAKTDIESVIEHAKTGYEEEPPAEPPVVEPKPPTQTADIGTAITAAEAFAIETYGVTIDSSLNFDNSAYRFPAVVPLTVDQDTFNYKAIDIVTYTFEQVMCQNDATIEKMREAGIRCKVRVVQNEYDYQIYCLYA